MHLMNTIILALHKKPLIKTDPAIRSSIQLDHPTADALRVKLLVPRRIKRVREVHPLAIPADLNHLRPARQRLVWILRMRPVPRHSSHPPPAGPPWVER